MTRFSSRALAGAAVTVLLGSIAIVPAVAEPVAAAAPVVTWVTSPTTVTDQGSYPYGAVPAAPTCTAVQDVTPVPCVVTGYAATVGVHTLTAVVADAPAATLTYTVKTTLKGFYGSVKENGTWNTRKGGSTIPLKFKIFDANGVKAKTKAAVESFLATPIPCVGQTAAVGTKTIDFLSVTKKGRTLKFHDGAFHQNWKTSKLALTKVTAPAKGKGHVKTKKVIVPSCYQVTMTAVDGQSLTALFKLR